MIKMMATGIQHFICLSCVSEMLREGFSDAANQIEMIWDERVDQPIILMKDDSDQEIRLMITKLAQHKQDDDVDVEIECYI